MRHYEYLNIANLIAANFIYRHILYVKEYKNSYFNINKLIICLCHENYAMKNVANYVYCLILVNIFNR